MSAKAETIPSATTAPSATTNWAPTAKVSAGVLAASATALLLPLISLLWRKLTGSDLSAPQGAALTTVITFVIQYLVPDRK